MTIIVYKDGVLAADKNVLVSKLFHSRVEEGTKAFYADGGHIAYGITGTIPSEEDRPIFEKELMRVACKKLGPLRNERWKIDWSEFPDITKQMLKDSGVIIMLRHAALLLYSDYVELFESHEGIAIGSGCTAARTALAAGLSAIDSATYGLRECDLNHHTKLTVLSATALHDLEKELKAKRVKRKYDDDCSFESQRCLEKEGG